MTRVNFEAALRIFSRQRPFIPFCLELTSGERLDVKHPEAIVLHDQFYYNRSPTGLHSLFDWNSVVRFVQQPSTT